MDDINSALCCFNYLNAYVIELLIIIFILFGLTGVYFCRSFIPWNTNPLFLEFAYLTLEYFFLILILVFLIPIIFYRVKNLVNLNKNKLCRYYSIACILSGLIGFIITLIFSLIISINMNSYIKNNNQKTNKKSISNDDRTKAIAYFVILCLIWIILTILSMSDLLRVNLKINASYKAFLEVINNEVKTASEMMKFDEKTKKITSEKKNEKETTKNKTTEISTTVNKFNENGTVNEIKEVIINPLDKKLV